MKSGWLSFRVKHYRKEGKLLTLNLPIIIFVSCFQLHILHKSFTRIRHHGSLSSTT
ncbi:transposase [Aquimarina agarivorans]|uniref:transposase n=1 Tax=Aquimarina agarivorans TaxID=980584 RepID=UPI0034DB2850